jgi:RNAse (barnase) inhibitor barstar
MSAPSPAERLQSTAAPWVHLFVAGGDAALPPPPPGFVERVLDGRRCATKRALLDEFARVLAFPPHFGRTWDALEDCLTDLDWLPGAGYRLVIRAADQLLPRDAAGYAALVPLLEDVGRAWGTAATGHPGRGAVPFHTVLVVPAKRIGTRRNWRAPRLTG